MKTLVQTYRKKEGLILGLLGVALFFTIWQAISGLKLVNPILVSSPVEVGVSLFELFASRTIYPHIATSLQEIIVGLSLSIFFGVILGITIGWYEKLEKITHPLIYSLYSTPIIAIFPLILIWFGFSIWSKILIIFLSAFFPILINTISAVKNLDPNFIKLAKSFKAHDFDIFKSIIFPSSLPFIISGIKIAIPRSIMGMVIGEFFSSHAGLGYLISFYGTTFQTDKLLAVVAIIIVISLFFSSIVGFFEKRTEIFKPEKNNY